MKKNFEKYKKVLLEIIYDSLPECKVYLFGSRARETHESGADIDLVLCARKKIDKKTMRSMKEKIEETTIPLFVDLVDIHDTTEELKKQIKKEGILWTA